MQLTDWNKLCRRLAGATAALLMVVSGAGCAGSAPRFVPAEAPGIEVSLTPVIDYGGAAGTGGPVGRLGFAAAVAARNGVVYAIDSAIPGIVELAPGGAAPNLVLRLRDGSSGGLHITPDNLLYVVDRGSRVVREIDVFGDQRRIFADSSVIPTPVDVTVTNWGSVIIIADELTQRIGTFDAIAAPTGLLTRTLSPVAVAASIRAIAATDRFVFVLDSASREVSQLDLDGRIVATYGEDDLVAPVALAVDECNRIFVADGHGDGLFVSSPDYVGDGARAALPPELIAGVTDLWVDGGELYVAAGVLGIHVFAIEPLCLAR